MWGLQICDLNSPQKTVLKELVIASFALATNNPSFTANSAIPSVTPPTSLCTHDSFVSSSPPKKSFLRSGRKYLHLLITKMKCYIGNLRIKDVT